MTAGNIIMSVLARAGLVPRCYVLTTRAGKTGRRRAAPILQRYVRLAPAARRCFRAGTDSPVEDFAAEADRHPVFELTPVISRG